MKETLLDERNNADMMNKDEGSAQEKAEHSAEEKTQAIIMPYEVATISRCSNIAGRRRKPHKLTPDLQVLMKRKEIIVDEVGPKKIVYVARSLISNRNDEASYPNTDGENIEEEFVAARKPHLTATVKKN